MPKMKITLKTFFVVIVCFIGTIGIPIRDNAGLKTNIGQYTVEPYQYGLTINNDYKSFYNISPYNFYLKENGTKIFDWSENVYPKEWKNNNKLFKIWSSFRTAIGQGTAVATLKGTEKNFTVKARAKDNIIIITYDYSLLESQKVVQTLSFNKDDLVLDDQFRLLNNPEYLDVQEIEKLHKIKITNENNQNVLGNVIYIMNVNTSGVIKVNLANMESITINNNERLIEMEPKLKNYNTMILTLYSNIKEAREDEI